ncbi:MAG: DUF2283 domain-containing protein [Crocosphaera sp.]|nr:DUF2283 domain-containing protein [Crocosphaera sp.]
MTKTTYSKDIDALLIEVSDQPIAYAEEKDNTILHYSKDDKLVLIEILDFRKSLTEKEIQELVVK